MKIALALGTFDGVHIGHKSVLDIPAGYKKIAVVFAFPPKSEINPQIKPIMSLNNKCSALKKCGIDEIYILEFGKIKDMKPEEFTDFLLKEFGPSYISCGYNYRYGKNALGDANSLKDFCENHGITLKCCKPVLENEKSVSSTLIREYLKIGEIEKANSLMTVPFSFTGEVINGDKRGRTLGFPTINQRYPENITPVKFGVYKTAVEFDGHRYVGMTNIGIRPTFKNDFVLSETFINGFSGDIYGKQVKIELIKFIRPEIKFGSVEELTAQVKKDIETILSD